MTSQNMTAHRVPAPHFEQSGNTAKMTTVRVDQGKARSSRPRLPRGEKMLFQIEKAESVRTLARIAGHQRDDDFFKEP
ncbi:MULTISPECIES: hypothetical protein [unclassified Janthinobacterium]|uniref:hypothetical protein n=1 Tax=unclassified Janthinobacterium TaxID=2610881 RepID=UPI0012EBE580|nr:MULTISPECIES: hypothetical protein [unclassified Janthinobacterium]MDN2709969.1 hypothetical protein [Janthinobacterium sp. SUN118]